MTRNLVVIALAAMALGRAADASAQPRWGRERQPADGVCFYEDRGYQGRYFCARAGDTLGKLPNGMGDHISSVRVLGSAEVTVFRDKDLRGRSQRFAGNVPDLRQQGWNDSISSIAIGRLRGGAFGDRRETGGRPLPPPVGPTWGREALPRAGACFYEDRDYRGRYFCLPRGGTYASLPGGFNDRISSIKVFGSEVTIFRDRDYHGRSRHVGRDAADLRGDWRDTISSIRVN